MFGNCTTAKILVGLTPYWANSEQTSWNSIHRHCHFMFRLERLLTFKFLAVLWGENVWLTPIGIRPQVTFTRSLDLMSIHLDIVWVYILSLTCAALNSPLIIYMMIILCILGSFHMRTMCSAIKAGENFAQWGSPVLQMKGWAFKLSFFCSHGKIWPCINNSPNLQLEREAML